MLIDNNIKRLVKEIDENYRTPKNIEVSIKKLLTKLKSNCLKKEAEERYSSYSNFEGILDRYPIDKDGYAVSFDPLSDEEAFYQCWKKFGIVVGRGVVPVEVRGGAINRIYEMMTSLSNGLCNLNKPDTWGNVPVDDNHTPVLSRGFFEVYHDRSLADLRQAIHLYIHHVVIWGRIDLWTSFDRFGVKLPEHKESKGLPLHVDQNPNVHPGFKTVQGVLALSDCPIERGTYVGVPGSKKYFPEYAKMAEGLGEYVELFMPDKIAPILQKNAQAIPLRAGDIISWDSRTTHANSENVSDQTRFVAYIAAGPAREENLELIKERNEAFQNSSGKNVREALMHASKPPRYTNPANLQRIRQPEELTLLGKLLYGQESYSTI